MNVDTSRLVDQGTIGASAHQCDQLHWRCHTRLEKYWAGVNDVHAGRVEPYEVLESDGNLLLIGGADILWLGLKNGLSATTNQGNTYFNNANAGIRVGNSTSAAANTQTDLQAASSRKFTKGMDATYPTHTTGTGSSTSTKILYKATFSTAQANFAWQEWGIVNRTTSGGRMLNRKVQSLGTKSTAATWALTVTLSLA